MTPAYRLAVLLALWAASTLAVALTATPILGAECRAPARGLVKREARPSKRKFPRSHKHRGVGRCLERDGKTWRKGCV